MLSTLAAAHAGATRFNEFRQVVRAIPARTLVARLGELEEAGLLERVVVASRPPRVEYRLTDRGRRVGVVVDALARWAAGDREPGPAHLSG